MKQLIHNGVLVPRYATKGFFISFRGEKIRLNPEQEEMAVAWVKKLETEYVKDKTFVKNFFQDFAQALNRGEASPDDIGFSEIQQYFSDEKNRKLVMSKEDRKKVAQERKIARAANKEKYGYAFVDGIKVEIGNYVVEPSSIFMGRGEHPMRGRWKSGVKESSIVLNLSPDAPKPKGDWKDIIWQPDSMWIAEWHDELQGKMKYVWLSDTSHVKQKREVEKFDKARQLENLVEKIKEHIEKHLSSQDLLRKKIATVCFLIDVLKLRVGDEKDKDEADTVGATTLRPEHISFSQNGLVSFDFLGKDSVRWHLETKLPDQIVENLKVFYNDANSALFKGVRSENVSAFLEEAVPGLTAKVFRTYHATRIVKGELDKAKIAEDSAELAKKFAATMANLEAAKACNHKKKIPKNWDESLEKMNMRLKEYREKRNVIKTKYAEKKKLRIKSLKSIDERIRNLQARMDIKKVTRDYNLNTSLKSYIDPRVYFQWGNKVGYDWKKYYPKTLQRKFIWVEQEN
ncbi:MAG: DNA topoisomerase I [Candidatus Bathyarchaeota archaeon]